MKTIITKLLLTAVLILAPATALVSPVYAACATGSNTSRDQVLSGIGEANNGNCNDSGVQTAIRAAVNILSLIIGIAAVVMIILGGLKYVTSGGDSNKVANAKGTITYALIGLVIAVLAQAIVHYVLTVASNQCPSDTSIAANDPRCQVTK